MFAGEFEHNLDDKGRIFLPVRYRESLSETVVLLRGLDGQVNLYPQKTWELVAASMGRQNQAIEDARDLTRFFFSAYETSVDRQGRIVISPTLRKHGALGSIVTIIGVNDHLEIWSQERWQAVQERFLQHGSTAAEKLAQLGLVL